MKDGRAWKLKFWGKLRRQIHPELAKDCLQQLEVEVASDQLHFCAESRPAEIVHPT